MSACAVIAFGALSALGEGVDAVDAGAVGAPPRRGVTPDAELTAAGLLRPFAARLGALGPADEHASGARDRATRLVERALSDCAAELDRALPGWRARRVGIAVGTSSGGMRTFERAYPPSTTGASGAMPVEGTYLGPVLAAALGAHAPETLAPFSLVLGACASSTLAIGLARAWLRDGRCDVAIAGGFDALSVFVASGFEALRATAGSRGPRPFRADREGLALGEGAAFMAMIREDDPSRPRALGWITGFGASCDAAHLTAPDRGGLGLSRAAASALADAGATEVGLVSAHGTATEANDAAEALTLAQLDVAAVPVHAFKGAIGHTLGAAGALETLAALVALERGVAPATVGEGDVIPGVRVLDRAEPSPARAALKLSAAFGGANGALVLAREPPAPAARAPAASRTVHVSRAVALTDPRVIVERLVPAVLAARTGYPEERIARADDLVRLALAAVAELQASEGPLEGAGIVVGEGLATLDTNARYLERVRAAGAARAEPRRFPFTTPNAAAGECAIAFGLRGPAFAVGAGRHGGIEALSVAADLVRDGRAERMVVVAVDEGGPASRRLSPGTRAGAVAVLVSAAPLAGRLEDWGVALASGGRDPDALVPPAVEAHSALLPLQRPAAGGPPERERVLEVATPWGIVAKARVFWL